MSNLTYSQTEQGLEVVILNSGEAFCTQSSYSRWTGVDRTTIVKRCQELEIVEIFDISEFQKATTQFVSLLKTQIETNGGLQKVVLIPVEIITHWLLKDNPSQISIFVTYIKKLTGNEVNLSSFKNMKTKTRQQTEKQIQKKLAKQLNGLLEVVCKTGVIDILTDNEIIEVKKIKSWKAAVGQTLVYCLEYPDKKPRIHLCGECSEDFKQMIICYCSKLKILVTFEQD